MKRLLALMIALVLLALPIASSRAAETGELLITSEKVRGDVGKIVNVDFYLYPNLPEGVKLGSLQGIMKYDSQFVTLGSINQVDTDANLSSWMKGRASKFDYNNEPGFLRFGFFDAYGVEEGGFWFQAQFRIEKEGATDFIFNGIEYTGIDGSYQTVCSYRIMPVSVGGIYTEGQTVPTGGAANETFSPLVPGMTAPPATGVASPTGTASVSPTASATAKVTATPKPTVKETEDATEEPTDTPAPRQTTAAPSDGTPLPGETAATSPESSLPPEPVSAPTDVPSQPGNPIVDESVEETNREPNMLLFTGVLIGIVALLGLVGLLILLIVKRRNKNRENEE